MADGTPPPLMEELALPTHGDVALGDTGQSDAGKK